MNDITIPDHGNALPQDVLQVLATALENLTPETRKAAAYVLENPNDVGVSSIREMADAARVKPNTFVRMARSIGFDGYEDFREPFREEIRSRGVSFPDRARWLQSLSKGGKLAGLYAEMAASTLSNVEQTFAAADDRRLKAAADAIVAARHTYVLGVGVNHTLAHNFAYLANMAVATVEAIPRPGGVALDDLARVGKEDVLLAMTFKPYRSEVVEAVALAREQGATIIGFSDSPASPIITGCDHGFVVQSDTPQFFPSTAATLALLETLMAFVIADADPQVIADIERFHQRRHALGIYEEEGTVRP
ncbi:MAG TPA: MurR/RpiR family transcriptional regulator [Kiloniellaceae bacterium]|nr:MurR/RpiR family transcriptional regulator [Kiloniellaceae bacterium]HIP80269.1 MurR/RpiR family transcriptional regulator [Kiloniellaceae bacterium]